MVPVAVTVQHNNPLDHTENELAFHMHDYNDVPWCHRLFPRPIRRSIVTASSCETGEAKGVVDFASNKQFRTKKERKSWICYNFKGKRVAPTSYSIRSADSGSGGSNLKSRSPTMERSGGSLTLARTTTT